nr:B3 domain-containing protein Os03g0212300-like [Aegilops tauschii subsp. strangulata]
MGGSRHRRLRPATPKYELDAFEFFSTWDFLQERLPDTFMKMLDGHRPKNVKLRQAGSGLRRHWDVQLVIRYDHMYLCHGWEQFYHAYDQRHRYFLLSRYDSDAMLTVKVFNTTMCRMCYQDDDDARAATEVNVLKKALAKAEERAAKEQAARAFADLMRTVSDATEFF